jgi:hypothetical protein
MELAEQSPQCATGQEEGSGGHDCATTNELSAYHARQHFTKDERPHRARPNHNYKRACQCPWGGEQRSHEFDTPPCQGRSGVRVFRAWGDGSSVNAITLLAVPRLFAVAAWAVMATTVCNTPRCG